MMKGSDLAIPSTKPVVLETERLILKPVSPYRFAGQSLHWTRDRQAMCDLCLKTDGWTFLSWWKQLRKFSRKGRMCHGIWPKGGGAPVGMVFSAFSRSSRDASTGIFIGEKQWRGGGISAEAKSALIDLMFQGCGANRVTSWANARNFASIHNMHKLGLTREAVMRQQFALLDGSLTDYIGFGLLRSEWLENRKRSGIEDEETEPSR